MAKMIAPENAGICVSPEEGERIQIFDEEIVVKVTGAETAGGYALITVSVAPGGGPPLHAHPGNETFSVLSGEFAFTQRGAHGVSIFEGGPGAVVHAPAGVPHRFENVSPTRSTLLIIVSTDSVDFLREMGAAFPPGAQPDMEKVLTINAKYGVETIHGEAGSRSEPPAEGATSARARALAWRFQQALDALITTIEGCTLEQWRAICADTGWTVGVQAHHIAQNGAMIASVIQKVADGQQIPAITPAMIDAANAHHAEEFADVTKEEAVALLREYGATAAPMYRGLSDQQLARTATLGAGSPPMSAAQLIEYLAIGEIVRHGEYLHNAISLL